MQMEVTKRQMCKIRWNRAKQVKSWMLKRQAQEAFPLFLFLFSALIHLPEQPLRVISFTDKSLLLQSFTVPFYYFL